MNILEWGKRRRSAKLNSKVVDLVDLYPAMTGHEIAAELRTAPAIVERALLELERNGRLERV